MSNIDPISTVRTAVDSLFGAGTTDAALRALGLNPNADTPQGIDRLVSEQGGLDRFGGLAGSSYGVKQGDTLDAIAKAHGTDWQTLARINGISNPDKINPGQQIRLPAGTSTSYTVQAGDTLSKIAAANGTTVSALAQANNIDNPNRIMPGQVLSIGGGAAAAGQATGGAAAAGGAAARPAAGGSPAEAAATGAPAAGGRPSTGSLSENGMQFIYNHEAQRGVSNRLHWPRGSSGVTLGPGYDMRGRSQGEIVRDLTAVGVDRATATSVSRAAGLSGDAARAFARNNANLVSLTPTQERALLGVTVRSYEQTVRSALRVPVTQNQFDSLVSFAYNVGAGGFRDSSALRLINQGQTERGGQAMLLWNRSGGVVNQGLVNRRNDEVALFNQGGSSTVQPGSGAAPRRAEAADGAAPAAPAVAAGRTAQDYVNNINRFGDQQARNDLAAGRRVVVALRTETDTRANNGNGRYDDVIAVVQRQNDGSYSLREFRGNTEPSRQYAYDGVKSNRDSQGNDVNGDGRRDQGRLLAGSYRFAPNGTFQGNQSFRATRTQVAERDTNQDGRFNESDRNRIDRTGAGTTMLIHQGGASNTWSAGCQTIPQTEFNQFLRTLGGQSNFSYVLINTGR
jgi:LysM repeat protein